MHPQGSAHIPDFMKRCPVIVPKPTPGAKPTVFNGSVPFAVLRPPTPIISLNDK